MLLTNIRQNGNILFRTIIIILVSSSLLCGCSADWWLGDGRGDWTLDLCAGYSITKINSREILFVYKENAEDPGGSIIISNYFVTGYQLQAPYICLKGIRTEKISISDGENNKPLSYFLVDTTDGEIAGPFESYDEFEQFCRFYPLTLAEEWVKTQ